MLYLVKVRVNEKTLAEFGTKLQKGELDRTCVRGETHCLREDPAVGYTVWEARDRDDFESHFGPWRAYCREVDVREVTAPDEAMRELMKKAQ